MVVDDSPIPSGGASISLPPCPAYLFTRHPALPFAPALTDAATLKAALKNSAESFENTSSQIQLTSSTPGVQAIAPIQAAVQRLEAVFTAADFPSELTDTFIEDVWIILDACTSNRSSIDKNQELIQQSGLAAINQSTLLIVLSGMVSGATSYSRSYKCAEFLVLPRLQSLNEPSSRDLTASIEHLGKVQAQALVEGCIVHLLALPLGLNKFQAEVIVQCIIKECPAPLLAPLLAVACTANPSGVLSNVPSQIQGPGSRTMSTWTEYTVSVLQAAIDRKPVLHSQDLGQFISEVCHASTAVGGVVKFNKLVLSMIKGYGRQCNDSMKAQLRAAVGNCDTFMKKSLTAALNKL